MNLKSTIKQRILATILLCLPLAAGAVGLGKLTVISNLGQPLNAELELVALRKEELSSLNIRMASPSAFSQANIQYAPYLPKIKFDLQTKSDGRVYYKVTSAQPITEPFLVMLVELNWAAGRLTREYTILLDPPEMRRSQPIESKAQEKPLPEGKTTAAIQLPETQQTQPAEPQTPVQLPESTEPSVPTVVVIPPPPSAVTAGAEAQPGIPTQKLEDTQTAAKPEDKPSGVQPEIKPAELASGSPVAGSETKGSAGEGGYTVKRGDTLADIAKQVKSEEVSLEQMLIALQRANKNAFEGNNINRLKTGQILMIPDKETALDVEHTDAKKLIQAQAADWNAYRQKVAEKAAQAGTDKSQTATQSATGTISAKAEDKIAPKEPSKDQLKLSKSETLTETGKSPEVKAAGSPKAAAKDADAAKIQERLIALQEEATAKDKAVKEANSRVADLEKTVKNLQEVLNVKNKTLEDLQKQAEDAKKAQQTPVKPEPEKVASTPAVTTAPKTEPTVAVNPAPVAPAKVETPAPVASTPAPTPEVKTEPAPAPVAVDKPAPQPEPAKPVKPVSQPDPLSAETSLLDEFLSNPLYWGGAGAVLLIIIALVLLSMRRKKNYSGFEDSIITGGDLKANTVFGNTGGGVVSTGDNSFITDFSREGLGGTIDTDEVDPIAEAEVYMAYGRDTQAEEILKDALQKDPNRHQIHVKLLEIYAGRKNNTAFETLASELYAATGGQGEHWVKAAELGRTLDASNPLYGKVGVEVKARPVEPVVAAAPAAVAAMASDELDFNKTLGRPAASLSATTAPTPKKETPNLDFNLETTKLSKPIVPEVTIPQSAPSFDIDSMAATPTKANGKSMEDELSLDIGSLNAGDTEPVAEEKSSLDEGLTFDLGELGMPTPAEPIEQGIVEIDSSKEEDIGLDFDFNPSATVESAPAVETKPAPGVPEMQSDIDLSSINLSFDAPSTPTDIAGAPMNFDPDTSPEAMWQQVATKLDLARAYQEMGDQEGAREILQEVVQEGDAKQKQDAEQLLAKLH